MENVKSVNKNFQITFEVCLVIGTLMKKRTQIVFIYIKKLIALINLTNYHRQTHFFFNPIN
jgi:hypothetical protein